jgi:hypothetical protein
VCRHAYNDECKIINKRCIFLAPNEERCETENGAIINYLKNIGTYENKVKNNPKYVSGMTKNKSKNV